MDARHQVAGPQPSSQIKCQRTVRAAWSSSYPSAPVLRARRRLLRRCMRRISASQAASSTEEQPKTWPMPRDAEETAQQAQAAAVRAWQAGVRRQRIELLLPLIGATDLDDWPGGIRQQFKAALPMVEAMLKELKKATGLDGRLTGSILDQGDAVGAWQSDSMAVVVFPTAETLKQVMSMADARQDGLVMLVNPQWQPGQVVSDFGLFGRKKAEQFLSDFEDTYCLKQLRLSGDSVRVLRSFPGLWQVHVVNEATGEDALLTSMDHRPSYAELQSLLLGTPGSNSSKGWAERLRQELQFNNDSLKR